MSTLTPAIFRQINRDIVIRWPYTACNQIDTYVRNDDPGKFNTTNLGMSYSNYLNGDFWSRFWTGQGSDPDTLTFQYPLMAQQSLNTYLSKDTQTGEGSEYTEPGAILFIGKYDCEDCGECNRTQWQISDDTKGMVQAYLELVFEYRRYDITDSDGVSSLWALKSTVDAMVEDGTITGYVEREDLYGVLEFDADLIEWEYKPVSNVIGWMVNYRINYCVDNNVVLSDSIEGTDVIGSVGCENC